MKGMPLVWGILLLGASACAASEFDHHFDSGRYGDALAAFEADPSLQASDQTLYRAASLHARPDDPSYDPARAVELLERLLTSHPDSPHRGEAELLIGLLTELQQAEARATQRESELIREIDRLAEESTRLEQQLDWLHTSLERQEEDREALYQVIFRITGDLRQKYQEFASLQEELERLKAIDLRSLRGGALGAEWEDLDGPTPISGSPQSANEAPSDRAGTPDR